MKKIILVSIAALTVYTSSFGVNKAAVLIEAASAVLKCPIEKVSFGHLTVFSCQNPTESIKSIKLYENKQGYFSGLYIFHKKAGKLSYGPKDRIAQLVQRMRNASSEMSN